jgi:hypothetical protein
MKQRARRAQFIIWARCGIALGQAGAIRDGSSRNLNRHRKEFHTVRIAHINAPAGPFAA